MWRKIIIIISSGTQKNQYWYALHMQEFADY